MMVVGKLKKQESFSFQILQEFYSIQKRSRNKSWSGLVGFWVGSMERISSENGSSHSWWLDNYNRPHQSLWLQSTLSEFSTKIKIMVGLIEDDGDTFAKRAEMFYQKRPLLIKSLEDLHKSFCALADKYDQLRSESNIRASNFGSSSNSVSQSQNCPHQYQEIAPLPVQDHHSDSEKSNFNFRADNDDVDDDVGVVEDENSIIISKEDYIRRALMWNDARVNASKQIEENLQRQAEIVNKVDETVKDLCAHIEMLVKENGDLKLKNSSCRSRVEITRSRSRISRVKDSLLKKLLR